jgi:hypothetical protein
MTRAWGMPASFVHNFFFLHTLWKVGFYKFPSPSNEALLTIPLLFSLTTTLLVEETLMDFGYTYYPNLIHQGAFVITETSSANGYKNSTSSNSYEVIHGPELTQNHSQRVKTIQLVQKLKGAMKTLGTCTHVQNRNVEIAHTCTMRDCCFKKMHT